MEFDKSRVYTALNADELEFKEGSTVAVANDLSTLKTKVQSEINFVTLIRVWGTSTTNRFEVTNTDGVDNRYNLCYLVSEPEEKKLKWTDLEIGDVIKCKKDQLRVMVVGINAELGNNELHICVASDDWLTDDELEEWEKVE